MKQLEHSHEPDQIAERLAEVTRHSYLRDFVYGGIDGAVTTFAVVSGVAGAGLASGIIIVLGIANLLADGFSMAASNFLGTKAEDELRAAARRMEERHIDTNPAGEREEIRQIFEQKGFTGEDLERVVDVITSDRERWINTMITDELGMPLDGPSPFRAAAVTFASFVIIGALPLLSFIVSASAPDFVPYPYAWSTALTAGAFFTIGAVKSRFVEQTWYVGGLETLFIGGSAAALAYFVGFLLGHVA